MNTRPTPSVVTDDGLVERVAKALSENVCDEDGPEEPWDEQSDGSRQYWCNLARAALAASDRDVLVRRIGELEATVERVRAALAFVEPRDRAELDRALARDIEAGMSLRKAAAKHGTNLSIARRATSRAALIALAEAM